MEIGDRKYKMLGAVLMLCGLVAFGIVSTTYKYVSSDDDTDDEPAATTTTSTDSDDYNEIVTSDYELAATQVKIIHRKDPHFTTVRPKPDIGKYLPDRINQIEDVYILYYNGNTAYQYEAIPLLNASELIDIKDYDKYRFTVFYIHGYLEDSHMEPTRTVVEAYKKKLLYVNVLTLDWSNMAKDDYLTNAALNAKLVGLEAAKQLNKLIKLGILLERLHIVGHSLGSHVAGYTARELKTKYKKVVKRITALDPVFPAFYPGNKAMEHVNAQDAEFVDIIHTDAGGFGTPAVSGTADFWPNSGQRIQPGCPRCVHYSRALLTFENLCSHWRSWRFYAESIIYPYGFAATPAESYDDFKNKEDPFDGLVYMGYYCNKNASGNYFLTTYKTSPFGGGYRGLYSPIT